MSGLAVLMEATSAATTVEHYSKVSPKIINNLTEDNITVDKCKQWLDNCSLSDVSNYEEQSDVTSTVDSSEVDNEIKEIFLENRLHISDENAVCNNEVQANLADIICKKSPNHYENIQIYKSSRVHIGDVTNINGPVVINSNVVHYSSPINDEIIKNTNAQAYSNFLIVPRRTWLAQPPLSAKDVEYLEEPAKFVIISHSASEPAYTQTENNLIVRLIQQFHIESRNWNDICYNFLVGAEGSIFEGRGWGVMGAHAYGYNRYSMGICFIGCFVQDPPSAVAVKKAKALIKFGVEIGAIDKDYKLLAHSQCSSTASPGKMLYEEIITWDHWDGTIDVANPSPLIEALNL